MEIAGSKGRTSVNRNHYHAFSLDEKGNGRTGITHPLTHRTKHNHLITEWAVKQKDNHVHTLKEIKEKEVK